MNTGHRTIVAMLTVIAVLLALSALVGMTTQPHSRQSTSESSDGVPYPEAIEKKGEMISVPILGTVLGETPQESLQGKRVCHESKSKKKIDRLKVSTWTDPRTFGLPQPQTPWHCFKLSGAQIAELYLTDGRITAVRLHFKQLNDRRAQRIVKALRGALHTRGGAESALWEGTVENNSVRVKITLMRDARFEGRMIYAYALPTKVVPNGEATLTFEVEPVEWYLIFHQTEPHIAQAMREQRLTVGMTEEQARATLIKTCNAETSVETTRTKTVQWFQPTDQGRSRHLKFTAMFRDGRITSVAQ